MSDQSTIDAEQMEPPAPTAGERLAWLVVRRGATTQLIDLAEGAVITIGRAPESTVQIDDPRVSREHARIHRSGAELWLKDLGSRNGTRVNDDTVRDVARRIASGDVLRLGDAELVVAEAFQAPPMQPPRLRPAALPFAELPDGVVVADPGMVQVWKRVQRVAAAPTTVLIVGETGVGKEVVAEQIHRGSDRPAGPFVRLNCGSMPENLVESELFGHEKGAFTGAERRSVGFFEAAEGGTLFLDEIGELSQAAQTRLLRAIETRRFMRVGGREEIAVDVRVVAATNRDLPADVKSGRFREDLYFRLQTFVIKVPPLRERPAEILLLAELFARQFARRMDEGPPRLSQAVAAALSAWRWPGNVRELRNAIEHAVVLADEGELRVEHLPEDLRGEAAPGTGIGGSVDAGAREGRGPMREHLEDVERRAIEVALGAEQGNQTRAARRLGISRRALIYKIAKYGLRK